MATGFRPPATGFTLYQSYTILQTPHTTYRAPRTTNLIPHTASWKPVTGYRITTFATYLLAPDFNSTTYNPFVDGANIRVIEFLLN